MNSQIEVANTIVHRDVVAIELDMYVNGQWYTSTGVARRHPADTFNKEIGSKLALSRALSSLANKLERQANGAIKHAEDVRIDRADKKALEELWDSCPCCED